MGQVLMCLGMQVAQHAGEAISRGVVQRMTPRNHSITKRYRRRPYISPQPGRGNLDVEMEYVGHMRPGAHY